VAVICRDVGEELLRFLLEFIRDDVAIEFPRGIVVPVGPGSGRSGRRTLSSRTVVSVVIVMVIR
jgi:hypothetical protein